MSAEQRANRRCFGVHRTSWRRGAVAMSLTYLSVIHTITGGWPSPSLCSPLSPNNRPSLPPRSHTARQTTPKRGKRGVVEGWLEVVRKGCLCDRQTYVPMLRVCDTKMMLYTCNSEPIPSILEQFNFEVQPCALGALCHIDSLSPHTVPEYNRLTRDPWRFGCARSYSTRRLPQHRAYVVWSKHLR